MRRAALVTLAFTILVGCVVQPPPPRRPAPPPPAPSAAAIDQRQRDLEFRIEQGFKAGSITGDERQLLRNQSDDVRRTERTYMNDGVLSEDERRALWSRLDALAREVDRQIRDRDVRK